MTRRSRGPRALAVLGASLALATVATAPPGADAQAGGATFDGAGWWWRAQTGVLALPVPPSVPESGLVVSWAPDGPTAVAAVRFRVPADASELTLTLAVADERGLGAGIMACAATDRWFPTQAGGWEEQPGADCDRAEVVGVAAADGSAWTFAPLAPLAQGTVLDLVLLPAPGDDADVAAFELVLEPPEDGALAVVLPPGGDDADATGDPAPPAPPAAVAPSPAQPSAAVDVPIVPPAPRPLAIAPPVAPRHGPQVAPPQPRTAAGPVPRPPIAGRATEAPLSARMVGILAALCTAVAAVDIGRRPTPPPRRLGTQAAMPLAGIGRFARPREGSPVPLL
jgi:hypothetical protein